MKKVQLKGGLAVNEIKLGSLIKLKNTTKLKMQIKTKSVYGFGHKLYYQNAIEVLRGKVEPETDGREGLKSLEILIAAYLASKRLQSCFLPLKY